MSEVGSNETADPWAVLAKKRPAVPPPESDLWPEEYRGKRWKRAFAILFAGKCLLCRYGCQQPKSRRMLDRWAGLTTRMLCINHPSSPGALLEVLPTDTCRNFQAKRWKMPLAAQAQGNPPGPAAPSESDPEIRRIPLGHDLFALVDAADYEELSKHKWHASPHDGGPYVTARIGKRTVYMHREIMRPPEGYVVDHIDHNRLNHRRSNLRVCTPQQNKANVGPQGGSSRFVGVTRRGKKWEAQIVYQGKHLYLGLFNDEAEAAKARDRKAYELNGSYAHLNFPEAFPSPMPGRQDEHPRRQMVSCGDARPSIRSRAGSTKAPQDTPQTRKANGASPWACAAVKWTLGDMRKIKSPSLAQLLMQLRFTPEVKRRAQLDAAAKLYCLVEPDKQYPYDFVCFHITGFQPKGNPEPEIIAGRDLLDDLQVFISKLSARLAVPAAQAEEQVHTIEELAAKFNVSTKTINRWRRRGLLARKFVFDGGGCRLGFLESAVERFVRENPSLVTSAGAFRRLTDGERQQAIRRARSLAARSSLSRHQITKKVAEKLGIAQETLRTLLLQYEKENPDKPVFRRPLGRIQPTEAAELYRLYKQGAGVPQLMKQFDRSRATVHRIINQRRAMALLARKIEYVPSDEFRQAGAVEQILGKPFSLERLEPDNRIEPFELVGENLLPEYLQVLKITPVLNREQEIELFRRYNYLKYLVSQERHQLKLSKISAKLLGQLEAYLDEAEEIRKSLVEANLRLVVSIAGKHTSNDASFLELVSKGNFALIQAVEEFDYAKGFRFSRRASLDIAKEYAKVSGRSTELTPKRAASLASIQRDLRGTAADVSAIERTRQSLAQVIREELDEREQHVILHHFGLIGSSIRKNTKTLKQIGDELGLTKERIRQIELTALQKLRQCMTGEQFELLMG